MEKSKIDWSKAPEWAKAVIAAPSGQEYFVEGWGFVSEKRQEVGRDFEGDIGADTLREGHVWELVELRPEAPKAIKSLEERIKERAIAALAEDVEEAMRRLRSLAQGAEHHPTSVDYMNISEAIDVVGAAIMKARSPVVADKALDKALERLAEHVDPSQMFMTAGTSRK